MDHKLYTSRLSQLIASPSVSCTSAQWDVSNEGVVSLLANWLEKLGFEIELQPINGQPGKVNLIATLGSGNDGLVLSGHTDTVPCNPDKWQQDPYKLTDKDQRFFGLGATDMKGFFPVVLAAIEALELTRHKGSLQQPLIILATADEESSMSGARALTELNARYAVIGEPTSMQAVHMHKGITMEVVRVQGLAGHSSNPALGHNALETMHAVLGKLMEFRKTMQANYQNDGFDIAVPTLNLGCIHGGDNPNRICGHCELQFDLRPLPGMNIDSLHDEINSLLQPLAQQFGTPIVLERLFPGVDAYEEPLTSELVKTAERLTGHPAKSVAFATEAPFLQKLGMQTIVMGPGSIDQAHQPNEYIEQSQLQPAVNIIESLIKRFCLSAN